MLPMNHLFFCKTSENNLNGINNKNGFPVHTLERSQENLSVLPRFNCDESLNILAATLKDNPHLFQNRLAHKAARFSYSRGRLWGFNFFC